MRPQRRPQTAAVNASCRTRRPVGPFCLQVHTYQRLTPFTILDQAVETLDNLRPGDCIVCFSKNDIYSISRQIEARGLECAVIYGSLPPGMLCILIFINYMTFKILN